MIFLAIILSYSNDPKIVEEAQKILNKPFESEHTSTFIKKTIQYVQKEKITNISEFKIIEALIAKSVHLYLKLEDKDEIDSITQSFESAFLKIFHSSNDPF